MMMVMMMIIICVSYFRDQSEWML